MLPYGGSHVKCGCVYPRRRQELRLVKHRASKLRQAFFVVGVLGFLFTVSYTIPGIAFLPS